MSSNWIKAGVTSSAGVEFVAAVAILSWAGHWADERWGTAHIFTLIGFFLGLVVGFYSLMKTLRRVERMDKETDEK